MVGTFLLVIIAFALRFGGATIRRNSRHWAARVAGWVLCASAVWLAASAAGAWSPWWPALVTAVAGLLLETRITGEKIWPVADAAVMVLAGLLSTPPLPLVQIALVGAIAVAVGLAADRTAARVHIRLPLRRLLLLGILALVFVALLSPQLVFYALRSFTLLTTDVQGVSGVGSSSGVLLHSRLIHLGITPAHEGERVVLTTGAVAWLDRPDGDGPFPGLIFFHGNDPQGSMQPAAVIFRRAARAAGFAVLGVDHPGYGQSPLPGVDADVMEWDPLPTAVAAVETLRAVPGVSGIIVAGHSMGAGDVLRLLAAGLDIDGAVLLGASPTSTEYIDYWYQRFHSGRRMSARLSPDQYVAISEQFYNTPQMLKELPPDHPPILFVRFEHEWPDITATRDQLYEGISGCKSIWDFAGSTHYFSTADELGLVFGDTQPTRQLAARLRQLAPTWTETAGEETTC